MELLQLVEDENYRRQRLNLDKVRGAAWGGCREEVVLMLLCIPVLHSCPAPHACLPCLPATALACPALARLLALLTRAPAPAPPPPAGGLARLWAALWAQLRVCELQILVHQKHGAHGWVGSLGWRP